MKKKGQAAMEFLMTYGWAILAAIIVIGVLAVYFRPSSLTSDSAVVTAPFYAVGATYATGQVQLEIRNNGGETLDVQRVNINVRSPTSAGCGNSTTPSNVTASATKVASFASCTGLTSGSQFSADVAIYYYRPGSTLLQTSTGTISGSVA